MHIKLFYIASLILIILLITTTQNFGENVDPKDTTKKANSVLDQLVTKIEIRDGDMSSVVRALVSEGLSVHLEYIESKKITVIKEDVSVKELLDEACEQTQGYTYETHNGSINVFPKDALGLAEKYPFNKNIKKFEVKNKSLRDSIGALREMSGVSLFVWSDIEGVEVKSLSIEGVSLREVLNEITKAAGLRAWSCTVELEELGKEEEKSMMFLRVE